MKTAEEISEALDLLAWAIRRADGATPVTTFGHLALRWATDDPACDGSGDIFGQMLDALRASKARCAERAKLLEVLS